MGKVDKFRSILHQFENIASVPPQPRPRPPPSPTAIALNSLREDSPPRRLENGISNGTVLRRTDGHSSR